MSMALTLDWRRCAGHGVCAAALGEIIELDRWGFPQGVDAKDTEVPSELVAAARMAVAACPNVALRLRRVPDAGS